MTRPHERQHRLGRESTRSDRQLRRIVSSLCAAPCDAPHSRIGGMVWMIRVRQSLLIGESANTANGLLQHSSEQC